MGKSFEQNLTATDHHDKKISICIFKKNYQIGWKFSSDLNFQDNQHGILIMKRPDDCRSRSSKVIARTLTAQIWEMP